LILHTRHSFTESIPSRSRHKPLVLDVLLLRGSREELESQIPGLWFESRLLSAVTEEEIDQASRGYPMPLWKSLHRTGMDAIRVLSQQSPVVCGLAQQCLGYKPKACFLTHPKLPDCYEHPEVNSPIREACLQAWREDAYTAYIVLQES
jgi:hypothetical protein